MARVRQLFLVAMVVCLAPLAAFSDTLTQRLENQGVIAAPSATRSPLKIFWNGATRFEAPEEGWSGQVQGFVQSRYTFSDNVERAHTSNFEVGKARLIISGGVLNRSAEYFLQTDFLGATRKEGGQNAQLKDAYLTLHPNESWGVKLGQYKTPLSRQYSNSDYATQFADRSLASDYFMNGREEGTRLGWLSKDGRSVGVSIFNGLSDHEGINTGGLDTRHTAYVDLRLPLAGKMNSFEEGDADWGEDWAATIGGVYSYADAAQTFGTESGDAHIHAGSFDANLKGHGLGIHAEVFARNSDVARTTSSKDSAPYGGYLQVGYFVVPKLVEVAVRYSAIGCDNGKASGVCQGNDAIQQGTIGVSYLAFRHHLKVQCNYDITEENGVGQDTSGKTTNKALLQLSSVF